MYVVPPNDAKTAFHEYKRAGKRLSNLQLLEMDWPDTSAVVIGLFEHLTDALVIPLRSRPMPMLHICLDRALVSYQRAMGEGDDARLRAFINTCLDCCAQHLSGVTVRAVSGSTHSWKASTGLPFSVWYEKAGCPSAEGMSISMSDANPSAQEVRAALERQLITPQINEILRFSGNG